jgi:predicted lipid-binding transport protein (Tim44 family)
MGAHDELLQEGPRTAPEPETAEQRSRRIGKRGLAGTVLGGGAAAAKFGGLKLFLWIFALNSTVDVLHLGLWGALLIVLVVVGITLARRVRRTGEDSHELPPLPAGLKRGQ